MFREHLDFGEAREIYLSVFQMSVASFQSRPILRQTTTYFPTTSCGGCDFVFRVTAPISRAAERPSGRPPTIVSFASLLCFAAWRQKAPIPPRPLTLPAPHRGTYTASA